LETEVLFSGKSSFQKANKGYIDNQEVYYQKRAILKSFVMIDTKKYIHIIQFQVPHRSGTLHATFEKIPRKPPRSFFTFSVR